ncbi:hypothetical protein L6452_13752 [Arctium lappa]|uniref:Uncharacterized protein n=1 Tax=Arctium lappa TaxID=4217 RepID=A0ACB9CJ26_ARCLA|nr:hypothetical protein L6452_13752 [Arctium lappa]
MYFYDLCFYTTSQIHIQPPNPPQSRHTKLAKRIRVQDAFIVIAGIELLFCLGGLDDAVANSDLLKKKLATKEKPRARHLRSEDGRNTRKPARKEDDDIAELEKHLAMHII